MKKGGVPLCPYFFIYGQSGIWKWAKWNDEKRVRQSETRGQVNRRAKDPKGFFSSSLNISGLWLLKTCNMIEKVRIYLSTQVPPIKNALGLISTKPLLLK